MKKLKLDYEVNIFSQKEGEKLLKERFIMKDVEKSRAPISKSRESLVPSPVPKISPSPETETKSKFCACLASIMASKYEGAKIKLEALRLHPFQKERTLNIKCLSLRATRVLILIQKG